MPTTEHVLAEIIISERVRYFPRQLITADDMRLEQDYFREKLRRHNRFLHGRGVVCGLNVVAKPTAELPLQIEISSGYALGPYGDEIYLPRPVLLDLATCGKIVKEEECQPTYASAPTVVDEIRELFVVIKYHECQSRPVRVTPAGCGCDDSACEYSRVRDSFELCCLTTNPDPETVTEANNERPCSPQPTYPWVLLGKVSLPAANQPLEQKDIDLNRRVVAGAV